MLVVLGKDEVTWYRAEETSRKSGLHRRMKYVLTNGKQLPPACESGNPSRETLEGIGGGGEVNHLPP
jgi:hypothetical protein